ncbi:MAG TPA: hypothetical protein ENO06_00935 [Methanolinea sp.]|nr:hypothetical protein [Methanolinea sp.]
MVRVNGIPEAARWQMATNVLTRLVVALGSGDESGKDISSFQERIYSEMADAIRDIADQYNMPRDHAADLVQTLGAVSVILFGPKFETRYIEGFPEEAVIRLAECPMFSEDAARGISPGAVNSVCRAYVTNAVAALNDDFTIKVTKARCLGDSFCEMVIERRKS